MKLSTKETGRLTMYKFNRLYQNYKDIFDTELMLMHTGKTYAKLKQETEKQEEWF